MRKPTKKRARAQGRKPAVVIPAIPELDEHANAIRAIGHRTFEGAIEMGRRLDRCRDLLKVQRVWLKWLKDEFGWSRRHADHLIDLFRNRDKVAKFASLGISVSALYLLSRASVEQVEHVGYYIEAGTRLSVADIKRLTGANPEPAAITLTSGAPSGPRRMMTIAAPPQEPMQRRTLMGGNLHRLAARAFAQQLALFASYLGRHEPDQVAAALPAQKREQVLGDVRDITTFLNDLTRALWETGKPRLVSDKGDEH